MTYAEPSLCQVDVRKVVSLRFECAYAGYVSGPEALLFSVRTTKSIKLKEDALPIHGLIVMTGKGTVSRRTTLDLYEEKVEEMYGSAGFEVVPSKATGEAMGQEVIIYGHANGQAK